MDKLLSTVAFSELVNWSVRFLKSSHLGYKKEYELYQIRDFLVRNRNTIEIEDGVEYRRVTVRLYNKGVTQRDAVIGNTIGTKRQYLISSGQFIMSKIDARNGAFGIVPHNLEGAIVTADFLTYNVDKEKISPNFLNLLTATKQFSQFCQNSSSGTTGRQRVKESAFLEIQIPLPSLSTQNRFVDVYYNKVNSAFELDEHAEKLAEEVKNYLNIELGIYETKNEIVKGKLNFVKFKKITEWGVDKNLQGQNTEFDTCYEILKVSDIANVSSGGTPSRSRKDFYENGNVLWVKTTEVVNAIITDTEEKITQLGLENSSAKLYPAGSLIIAMYGQGATRGRTAKLGVEASTNQACAVLTDIDLERVDSDFLWFYLTNEYDRLRALASGNNQPNLNAGMIKNYPVVLPPLQKQKEIVSKILAMKAEIKETLALAELLREDAIEEFQKSIFEE